MHEVFGLDPDIVDVAQRFADAGYAAVVPDLFSHGSRLGCLARTMLESNPCGHRQCLSRVTSRALLLRQAGQPSQVLVLVDLTRRVPAAPLR